MRKKEEEEKVKETLDVSASLPFPSLLPSCGQECFNFRDIFCLSSGAGWPVVQTMRCDGCKTIKKEEWERTKKKSAHVIGQI